MSEATEQSDSQGLPSITIARTTRLWAVVTEELRAEIAEEYQQAIDNVDGEIKELETNSSRMVTNLFRTNPQQAMALRQQVQVETRRRERLRERLQALKKQAEELELGSEYLRGTVQTFADVKPGDRLSDHMCGVEIVSKDGVVQEIRQVDPDAADAAASEFESRMGAVGADSPAEGDSASEPERPSGVQIITPGGARPAADTPLRLATESEATSE